MKRFVFLVAAMALLLPPMVVVSRAQAKQVLHYTQTTGYNHNTKSQSLAMFNSWAAADSFVVTNDDTGAEFETLANLQQYAVVVWSNTSGSGGLSATQRANFEAYINTGGSYLGIHAASDTYRHSSCLGGSKGKWDWYAETVAGASVQTSPNHTSSNHNNTMTLQAPQHPSLANLPNPWNKTEEYYYWEKGYLNPTFTELLRVGQTGSNSWDTPRMMAHCKELLGGGRAFYTALGHSGNNYTTDQNFRQLIRNALGWIFEGQGGFFISWPEPVAPPVVETGFFVLEEFLPGQSWERYDMSGRIIERGTLTDTGRIPVTTTPGLWTYRTYHRRWVHGVTPAW